MTVRHGIDDAVAQMEGPAGLPRSNGELVFQAPWESRAFAMAVALSEASVYDWEDFRQHLIDQIGRHEDDVYYECWLVALEALLCDRGLLSEADIVRRAAELEAENDHHGHHH